MFGFISDRISGVIHDIFRKGKLSKTDVNNMMSDIRQALLEADVSISVINSLITKITELAVGEDILQSLSPGQHIVYVVHQAIVESLGSQRFDLNLKTPAPSVIMMIGLQGSGKTTTSTKLAALLSQKTPHHRPLLASLDTQRPAAQEQLQILATTHGIECVPVIPDQSALQIAERSLQLAKKLHHDVLILDTAGRLTTNESLMEELLLIKQTTNPSEIILVADSLTGQDSITIAKHFDSLLNITGIILTRMDSDTRGGAALSMHHVTGKPIKFIGIGEKIDDIDVFDPERVAGRILGMGDIVALAEKAKSKIDRKREQEIIKDLQKGQFNFNNMAEHLEQMLSMGGVQQIMSYMPDIGGLKNRFSSSMPSDADCKRQLAIIYSMNLRERTNPSIINSSRKRRIAAGSGTTVASVNRLLKQFEQMSDLIKTASKNKGGIIDGIKSLLSGAMGGSFGSNSHTGHKSQFLNLGRNRHKR